MKLKFHVVRAKLRRIRVIVSVSKFWPAVCVTNVQTKDEKVVKKGN